MRPTELLYDEHRVIERVLDCLEQMVERCEHHGELNAEDVRAAIDFFRNFADGCHHAKEEDLLFPAMEAKGFARDGGPTGVMLEEHELGRTCVRGMAAALVAAADGDETARARLVGSARQFIRLLRQHIEKEDHCLFPMADQAFTQAEQDDLSTAFTAVEDKHREAGIQERYRQIAEILSKQYKVRCDC